MDVGTIREAGFPATMPNNNPEAAHEHRISELSEEILKLKAQNEALKLELEKEKRVSQLNTAYSQLIQKVTSTVLPVLNEVYEIAGRPSQSQEFAKLLTGTATALQLTRTADASRRTLDKHQEEEETPFINPIDAHYQNLEKNRSALVDLYERHLKPTQNCSIKDIVSILESLKRNFSEAQGRIKESRSALLIYIKNLRTFIDFLEKNPIPAANNPSIAQFLTMQDEDMINCLQFDVCNIEDKVKGLTEKVKTQVEKNSNVIKELKSRHDKMLKQYVEFESLIAKIELRIFKLSHYVTAQPSMLALKEDAAKFQRKLAELENLLDTRQGSLLDMVKQILSFLTEYKGKNPLKDDKFPDPKFESKIQAIELKLKGADIKFGEDAEYCGLRNGTAPVPEKGLFDRAVEVKKTAEDAISMLIKLIDDYSIGKMSDRIFCMKFYDEVEEAKLRKEEIADFITELNEINDLLVKFRAGWLQTATLFAKTMPPTLNVLCSSVLTKDGEKRGTGHAIKGVVGWNTEYVLPPFIL